MLNPEANEERTCPICGRIYYADPKRLKWGRQTTCSRRCSYKFRSQNMRKRIRLICAVCGKEFYRAPSQIKSKHKAVYCSPACQYRGRTLGLTKRIVTKPYRIINPPDYKEVSKKIWASRRKNGTDKVSDVTRRKLSKITSEMLASGRIRSPSKIEDIVAKALESLNISYKRQKVFRDGKGRFFCVADFYLPTMNSVIEVNGTFWHADPRVYSRENLKPIQERTVDRYARKVKLYEFEGINLIEIWEQDLREEPFYAVVRALNI